MRGRAGWWPLVVSAVVGLAVAPSVEAQPAGAAKGARRARPTQQTARPTGRAGLAHSVQPGETLWKVAREHGVPLASLARANRLAPRARLRVGQRLLIPLGAANPDSQEPPSFADIVLTRPPVTPTATLARPVPGAVGSPFGPRGRAWHGGVDLRAERGAPIVAAAPGMVIMSGWERAYGRVVKIWHLHDLMTVYAHNLENKVKVGDWVEQGQVIATVGSTGRATAPHLHFEVRLSGRKYDPLYWLAAEETVQASAAPPGSGPLSP